MVGATATLAATPRDATGNPLSGRATTWSSGNQAVATVSAAGVVTGVAPGTATIAATSEGRTGSAEITVLAPVASVTVAPAASTLLVGAATALTATVRDAGNNVLPGRTITWVSANPAIATVSPAGLVTALAPGGPVLITATSEGQSGTAQVTVIAPVASVTVTPAAGSVLVGNLLPLQATPRDAGGNPLAGRQVTWTSSNQAVATVSSGGVVSGIAPGGPVLITATSEGQSGTALVTVLAPVATVVFTGNFRNKVGDTYQFTATARLSDGTIVNRPMTFSVAEPGMAVMTADGQLTPLQSGTITLEVTIDGVVWETTTSAYDWFAFGSGTVFGISLTGDLSITNKWGTTEYPDLVLGCSGGQFLLYVGTDHFVTQNGLVSYAFDSESIESALWLEFDLFSNLAHPGPSLVTRAFASRMATARKFWFGFTEFNASAKATMFRVTGLASRLPAFATCPMPSTSPAATADGERIGALEALVQKPSRMSAERALRAELHAAATISPELSRGAPAPANKEARRRPVPRQ